MSRYAEKTEVSSDRSRAEIERTLQRYGAQGFLYGWDRNQAVIGFKIRGRQYRVLVPLPDRNDPQFTHTPARGRARSQSALEAAWEQAVRQRWRAMARWIKATLEAAESGIVALETALQPYTVLPSGQTAGDWLAPQIEAAYQTGHMPPMLPAGDAENIVEGEIS